VYEGVNNDEGYQILFSANTITSKYLLYCDTCVNSQECFGCVGLRDKKYCILNKQYEKAEYERLVAKIIEQMQKTGERGEFFHPSLSPFGYNETAANNYYSKEKSDFIAGSPSLFEQGYYWSDYSSDPKLPENAELLIPSQYSDEERAKLTDDDTVLKKILICAETQRPFTIQKLELTFLRKYHLPLPKLHPDVRNQKRMKVRAGRTLYLEHCDKCGKEMLSVYHTNSQFKVLCETCYQKEVYG
jgi:hypothetical protein